jgi:hypothetical protein
MASMSMVISPMSIDFIIAIVSIWISRVLVGSEGPDAAEGLRRTGDATRERRGCDRTFSGLLSA